MQRQGPPKHRHDGTSPLPLGMDWSPPPRLWAGRETVWPHDPRTGWSYCITIPSWNVLAKSRDSDPTVFYRVQVGIQSPEGITTTRTVLRRFNNFLKLHAALKSAFPQKNLPPTPPKGLLPMKTRAMLEGRRSSLEEWMSRLLADIDLSRSIAVASFLELEAAARSCVCQLCTSFVLKSFHTLSIGQTSFKLIQDFFFRDYNHLTLHMSDYFSGSGFFSAFQEEGQQSPESHNSVNSAVSSLQANPNSRISAVHVSSSLTSDYGSDTAYETSEIGTPSLGRDNNSESGTEDLLLDDELTSPIDKFVKYGMSNIDEGLSMGQAIIEHLEVFPKHKLHAGEIHNQAERNLSNGNSSKVPQHTEDALELLSEPDHGTITHHVRKISNESIGSDMCSHRSSELSNLAFSNSNGYGPEVLKMTETFGDSDFQLPDDVHLVVPLDQRQKLNWVLTTMRRRLVTSKTDMEDLISRLNQEIAVKDYLATKVKDLEVELETTRQKSKENLEQAILIERDRVTQMQWDMEELRRKSMEMELKLNSQEARRLDAEITKAPINQQKDVSHQELDSAKLQFEDLLKQHRELEVKSKGDIKVLVKEVKSLRSSQAELKQQLNQLLEEKSKAEELLQEERGSYEQVRIYWRKLLSNCKILHTQLQECKINYLTDKRGDDFHIDFSSLANPEDCIATSDNQIGHLISEVQHVAQEIDYSVSTSDKVKDLEVDMILVDDELRKMLTSILFDNGVLRKQVNSLILYALRMNKLLEKDDTVFPSDINNCTE